MMTQGAAASAPDDRRARRNVAVLFIATGILGAQLPINIIFAGLAGKLLASDPAFATFPVTAMVLAAMFSAMPASLLMARVGRRAGFLLGALAGAIGAGLSVLALIHSQFWLLLMGAALTGVYQAFQGYYRFAAADMASESYKPRAISMVMAGGLISALLGPEIGARSHDWLAPVPFAGAYLSILGLTAVGAIVLLWLDIPTPPPLAKGQDGGRPLAQILRQPATIVAVICGMVSYALMNLIMTSTPLAMVGCGYETHQAADVVRWHAFAMYAPSFFTGALIARFGHQRVIWLGLALLLACGLVALSGVELHKFYIALILLGLGWNFGFVGATALLSTSHSAAERARVQGFNDFAVFGMVSLASASSGIMMHYSGWNGVNMLMVPFLTLAGAALIWLALTRRS